MPESRLVAVAAHGLAGSRTDLPDAALSPLEWFDLVQGCLAADMVGFLAAAAAAGHLPVTDDQADELAALESERAGLTLLVERRAIAMSSLLHAAGIGHRVIDGPARRLAYGATAGHHSRAVQVLVSPHRLDEAHALRGPEPLGAGGAPIERRERLVLRASLAGMGQLVAPGRGARPIDAPAGFELARPDLVDQMGPGTVVELAGCPVPVLTVEQQLVVACVEMIAAPVTSLMQLRDVAQLALSPRLDGRRARRLAEAAHVVDDLADGLALAWNRFDLADKTELSVWALRRGGARPDRSPLRRTPPAAGRSGLAQRVLGRRQPVPAGSATATSPLSSPSSSDGPSRSSRSTRR